MTDRDDENFVSRWSRRKRAGGAAPVVAKPAAETAAEAPAEAEPRRGPPLPHAARPPHDAVADAPTPAPDDAVADAPTPAPDDADPELPDIDSLDKDSDYTVFMRDGVPEHLRRLALRKLWRMGPVHSIIDGLDDYDDDFTKLFTDAVTKNVKSAFRVGRGFATDDETSETAEDAAEDAEAAETPEDAEATEDAVDDDAASPADDRSPTEEPLAEAGDDGDSQAKG